MSQFVITNEQYSSQAATLFQSTGPVVGYQSDGSINQKWGFDSGLNAGTGTYATPLYENPGASIVGNFNPYTWKQVALSGDLSQIETTDGQFVWRLSGGSNGDPVVLQATPYSGSDSVWNFSPVA